MHKISCICGFALPVSQCLCQMVQFPEFDINYKQRFKVSQDSCRSEQTSAAGHSLCPGKGLQLVKAPLLRQDVRLDGLPAWWDVDVKDLSYLPRVNAFWCRNFFHGSLISTRNPQLCPVNVC